LPLALGADTVIRRCPILDKADAIHWIFDDRTPGLMSLWPNNDRRTAPMRLPRDRFCFPKLKVGKVFEALFSTIAGRLTRLTMSGRKLVVKKKKTDINGLFMILGGSDGTH